MRYVRVRDDWVDYAKAVGIILVVYGHVARGLIKARILEDSRLIMMIDQIIYAFHMPLFFFLSGLFFMQSLASKGAVGLVRSKLDTVAYPYFVWSLIQGVVEVSLSRFTNGSLRWSDLIGIAVEPRAQFWFLYALFLLFVCAVFIYRRAGRGFAACVFVAAAIANLASGLFDEPRIMSYVTVNLVFFAAGVLFSHVAHRSDLRQSKVEIGLVLLAGCLYAAVYCFYSPESTNVRSIALLLAISGIGGTVAISRLMAKWCPSEKLAQVGQLSMQIYLMHIIAGSGVRVVLSRVLSINDASIHLVIGTLSGVLVPLVVAVCMRKLGINWLYVPPRQLRLDARRYPL